MNRIFSYTVVPNLLIENFEKYNITEAELILILKLKAVGDTKIDLIAVLQKEKISKDLINALYKKQIIDLKEEDQKIYIMLEPLYKMMLNDIDEGQSSNKNENGLLTMEEVDKIKYIFNRDIKPYEIEKIKHWKNAGYTFEDIEEAIYKALVKNITNLNYIEAILYNELENTIEKEAKQSNDSLVRNWTFK